MTEMPTTPCSDAPIETDLAAGYREWMLELVRHCAEYRTPSISKAALQLANTILPFLALFAGVLWCSSNAYFVFAMILAIPAGGFLVRLFIIQHDCGHGSFFHSQRANALLGVALSVFTVTPFDSWKRAHALHHASNGNLSRRGTGDIKTLTVAEYVALKWFSRWRYRLYRNPIILILIGSPFNFMILQRLPFAVGLPWRTAWRDVIALDLVLVIGFSALVVATGGVLPALLGALPIVVAAWIGGWLFFVQHQYEGTTWQTGENWDFKTAALEGSSYYVLPTVLRWFSGNVGLHHVHHLNSRIPNYRLQACLDAHRDLPQIGRLTLLESVNCVKLALWDQKQGKMISFRALKAATAGRR